MPCDGRGSREFFLIQERHFARRHGLGRQPLFFLLGTIDPNNLIGWHIRAISSTILQFTCWFTDLPKLL